MAKEKQISTNELAAIIEDHENRLDKLEDFMRQAKTTLKIK